MVFLAVLLVDFLFPYCVALAFLPLLLVLVSRFGLALAFVELVCLSEVNVQVERYSPLYPILSFVVCDITYPWMSLYRI